MRATADAEDRTEKAAVTPGPLAPARELLGEMLLASNDPRGALEEFEATLVKEPNRFRALYGAAKAAMLAGDRAVTQRYFAQLTKICLRADTPGRPEVQEARANTRRSSHGSPEAAIRHPSGLTPKARFEALDSSLSASPFRKPQERTRCCMSFSRLSMPCAMAVHASDGLPNES